MTAERSKPPGKGYLLVVEDIVDDSVFLPFLCFLCFVVVLLMVLLVF